MKINIHLLIITIIFLSYSVHAQDSLNTKLNAVKIKDGFYQKIDLNPDSPCSCDQKTQRTFDLAKGLRPKDVLDYSLHAYSFTFGNNTNAASKLFKAIENDFTVYKISMKEWTSFMLLTGGDFDVASFEQAAKLVFATFTPMTPEEFLKIKNTTSYYEYIQAMEEFKSKQQPVIPVKN